MKTAIANAIRAREIARLFAFITEQGEDAAMVTSNAFNFPTVYDGEECFVEVTAKVVKKDADDCYAKRDEYVAKVADRAAKAAERERKTAERKAKAEARAKEKAAATEKGD